MTRRSPGGTELLLGVNFVGRSYDSSFKELELATKFDDIHKQHKTSKSKLPNRIPMVPYTPRPIFDRDLHGPENSIPLSPQWLLPKSGDNKLGAAPGDPPVNCNPNHGSRSDFLAKASGNGEESLDTEKRKDVWRSSSIEAETIRREHWRDEERENNSNIRRDRWREGDKDLGDHRRLDRWSDNPSGRNPGELRRLPSDRWNDSSNRETSYEARRESKWDTRWGREEKDMENRREKWLEPNKDGEGQREKGLSLIVDNSKDSERETDHNPRPWRSNSLQNRGRGEASYLLTPPSNKQAPGFGFGRGRGDVGSPGFTAGRGRGNYTGSNLVFNSSNFSPLGAPSERWDTTPGNGSTLKYSRAKLLGIYRKCGMKPSFIRLPDGFTEIPLLTQAEALEPLALFAPSQEEEMVLVAICVKAVLEGIDKGDIISSGAPQFSKDGALSRNRDEVGTKLKSLNFLTGVREDGTSTIDGHREEGLHDSKVDYGYYQDSQDAEKHTELSCAELNISEFQERQALQDSSTDIEGSKNEDSHRMRREELAKFQTDASFSQESSVHRDGPWRSQVVGEELQGPLHDWGGLKSELRSQRSDAKDALWSRSMLSKDQSTEHERNMVGTIVSREDGINWPFQEALQCDPNRNTNLKRHPSEVLEKRIEGNRMLAMEGAFMEREKESTTREGYRHVPPEELSLIYRDPQGVIQGPFSGADMIGWFEGGYFGIDLPVRLANAPAVTPFSSLGDIMPHLQMKARAPPGFGTPKQGETTDAINRGKFISHGKMQANITGGGLELTKNEQKNKREPTAEAENSFVESFMTGKFSSSQPVETFDLVEGGQLGFQGLSPGGSQSMGVDSGLDMNYAIGRRMSSYPSVERQNSLPNLFPYIWSARDASPLVTHSETVMDSLKSSPQLSSMTSDPSHTISHANQQGDIMSILQGATDNSGVSPLNKVMRSWPNYADVQSHSGLGHGSVDIPHQEQLEMHHLQRFSPVQSGFPFQHQRQQQQHQQHQQFLPHLISPPSEKISGGMLLEQLLPSAHPQDPQTLSLLQQQQQQQQQLLLSQLQLRSQASMPSQVSLLDQLLLLQQQKQQQQLLPQVLLEQISHQHFQEPSYERVQASGALGNTSSEHLLFKQAHDTYMMNAKLPQHVPSPQVTMVDNHLHLTNQQALKGANLSQQSQLDDDLKLNQVASVPQQSIVGETLLSDTWEATEPARFDKVQTLAFSPSVELLEKAAKEHQMPHHLDRTTSIPNASVSNATLDSEVVRQDEQILADTVSPTKVNDLISLEKSTGLLTCVVSDSPVGHVPEQCSVDKHASDLMGSADVLADEPKCQEKQVSNDTSAAREAGTIETRDVKKGSEKRSRKQKNSKISSERQKGQSEMTNRQQVKQETEISKETQVPSCDDVGTYNLSQDSILQVTASHNLQLPVSLGISGESVALSRPVSGDVESLSRGPVASSLPHRAWKPAPCPKPKSLLEIQQEEQLQKAETEKVASEVAISMAPSSLPSTGLAPWGGAVIGSEFKSARDQQDVNVASVLCSGSGNLDNSTSTRTKKSHLHDLLAEEVLAKTSQQTLEAPVPVNAEKSSAPFTSSLLSSPVEVSIGDENEFVEAKETKKSRKRTPKGKGAAGKTPTVASLEPPVASVSMEKSKTSRQVQQEKDVLPAPLAGPSFGDFFVWKGEYSSSPPAPAWSVDTGKNTKAASLREIQKEQERKSPSSLQQPSQVPATPKVQANRSSSGSNSTWQHPTFPPSPKTMTPTQSNALPSSYSRSKTEDELFWGPVSQSKQETEQYVP
eukprot:Gb_20377 [translate_table: standard]